MRVLVSSQKHGLLPFAWRLHREGATVDVVVWDDKYEKAWDGLLDKSLRHRDKKRESLEALAQLAKEEGAAVLADSARGQKTFGEVGMFFGSLEPRLESEFPTPGLAVGAWFDGEEFKEPHLLLPDWGVWPYGMGPNLLGGLTLVTGRVYKLGDELLTRLEGEKDWLKSVGHKGLVSVWLTMNMGREFEVNRVEAGWSFLHSHAFVSELEDFAGLLAGGAPSLKSGCVVVVPVTMPPYPYFNPPPKGEVLAQGVDPKGMFLHDFYTKGDHQVWAAGLDGLFGVARGSGQTPDVARAKAMRVAGQVALPEKQYRPDAGASSGLLLAVLEEGGAISSG